MAHMLTFATMSLHTFITDADTVPLNSRKSLFGITSSTDYLTVAVNFTENPCSCIHVDIPTSVLSSEATYGNGCAAHDLNVRRECENSASSGELDWCHDEWCWVDPLHCDQPTYKSNDFSELDIWYSYKSCDATFAGNALVGYCECIGNNNSFGSSVSHSVDYGGASTGKDSRGCGLWDLPSEDCQQMGFDACYDPSCFVDPNMCDVTSYPWENDGILWHFSYKACNASFDGNMITEMYESDMPTS